MTVESATPTYEPQRRARVHPEHHGGYPVSYQRQWFRVVERHDPDVPATPDRIWLDLTEGVQQVPIRADYVVAECNPGPV